MHRLSLRAWRATTRVPARRVLSTLRSQAPLLRLSLRAMATDAKSPAAPAAAATPAAATAAAKPAAAVNPAVAALQAKIAAAKASDAEAKATGKLRLPGDKKSVDEQLAALSFTTGEDPTAADEEASGSGSGSEAEVDPELEAEAQAAAKEAYQATKADPPEGMTGAKLEKLAQKEAQEAYDMVYARAEEEAELLADLEAEPTAAEPKPEPEPEPVPGVPGERPLPALTRERLAEFDLLMRHRSAYALSLEFQTFEELWLEACRLAQERAERAAKDVYGKTLGTTKLNVDPALQLPWKERSEALAKKKESDAAILAQAVADDADAKIALRDMEREWGIKALPKTQVPLENKPLEVAKLTLQRKYPNLSWDEVQRTLKDLDEDYWNRMEPGPPPTPFKSSALESMYRRPEASDMESKKRELDAKFQTMIQTPWVMHTQRTVNVTSRGKVQSFKCMVFAGNGAGFGGYSIGKGKTPKEAQDRAQMRLVNSMIFLPRFQGRTLFHDSLGRFNSIRAVLKVRRMGAGCVASNFGMCILSGFGLDDVSLNIWGGDNPYSWMHAIFDALLQQTSDRSRAQMAGRRLYREVDYNDIPVPAPDEAEWAQHTERVRDAVLDQVYINPIVYPERMATAEEKRDGVVEFHDVPYASFARPGHQMRTRSGKIQWASPNYHGARYQQWMQKKDGWLIGAIRDVDASDAASIARNK